jgi:hypothetical protein
MMIDKRAAAVILHRFRRCRRLRVETTILLARLRFFRPAGRKNRKQKSIKYHAAARPELACPELVEGSKGRLRCVVRKQEPYCKSLELICNSRMETSITASNQLR